jgi:hypothetical protein
MEKVNKGKKWEAIGTLLCIVGIVLVAAGKGPGGVLLLGGLVVFVVGRFK